MGGTSNPSLRDRIANMEPDKQRRFLESLTDREASDLMNSWAFYARQDQLPPDGYRTWLILAGRGW